MPFEDRPPMPGEAGKIVLVDLEQGNERVVAETCGWEQQMGANLNWGDSDQELYFNDVDTNRWKPFAWRLDPLSGIRQKLNGPVYHASPDGCWLIAANPATMGKTQPGYGVVIPEAEVRWNTGAADDDGFFLTDTRSGESRLLLSIRTILEAANPQWASRILIGWKSMASTASSIPRGSLNAFNTLVSGWGGAAL